VTHLVVVHPGHVAGLLLLAACIAVVHALHVVGPTLLASAGARASAGGQYQGHRQQEGEQREFRVTLQK
jgi:hypothetical protein